MTRPAVWTDYEQRWIIEAYVVLLDAQNNGVSVNKSAHRRATLKYLPDRSAGSYEFKMCNISAALNDSGNVYVIGYKPRSGYQRSLLQHFYIMRPDLVPNRPKCKTHEWHTNKIHTYCWKCGAIAP